MDMDIATSISVLSFDDLPEQPKYSKKKVARKHVTQTLMETSIDYIYEYGSAKFYLFWRARYYCFFFKGAVAVNGRRKMTILKTEKIQSALWQNCFIDSDFTYSG